MIYVHQIYINTNEESLLFCDITQEIHAMLHV